MSEKIQGFLRHGLTTVGGYLGISSYMTEDVTTGIVGAITAGAGFVWSWFSKEK